MAKSTRSKGSAASKAGTQSKAKIGRPQSKQGLLNVPEARAASKMSSKSPAKKTERKAAPITSKKLA